MGKLCEGMDLSSIGYGTVHVGVMEDGGDNFDGVGTAEVTEEHVYHKLAL